MLFQWKILKNNRVLNEKSIFYVIFLLFLFSTAAMGATYYVAPSGNDSNSGSTEYPWRTIQKAADRVSPGDTVIIKDGTYTHEGAPGYNVIIGRGGTEANPIIFKSENLHGAKLSGNGDHDRQNILISGGSNWIRIEGLWLDAAQTGIRCNPSAITSNTVIRNVKITNMYCSGIMTGSYTRNFTVENCVFNYIGDSTSPCHGTDKHNPYTHEHGWYAQGAGHVAKNNIFSHMGAGWAIKIDGYLGSFSGSTHTIVNNTFAHADNFFAYSSQYYQGGHITFFRNGTGYGGATQSDMKNVVVSNNVFYNPPVSVYNETGENFAIQMYDTPDLTLSTLTMTNNVTDGKHLVNFSPSSKSASDINIYKNNLDGTTNSEIYNSTLGMNNPESNDFTLTDAAVYLIDTGASDYAPSIDYENTVRPQGQSIDIGAYEYVSSLTDDNTDTGTTDLSEFSQYYETENMNLTSPMAIINDTEASGSKCISPTSGTGSSSPIREAYLEVEMPESDTYYLWIRVKGTGLDGDALYAGINNLWDRVYPENLNSYEWVRVETVNRSGQFGLSLSKGINTLQVSHGEINARADKLFITNNSSKIPQDQDTTSSIDVSPAAPEGLKIVAE